jgi:hypothetical protein
MIVLALCNIFEGVPNHMKPAKGGTFSIKSKTGVPVAVVSIKAGKNIDGATIAIKLVPATPGGTVTSVNPTARVVDTCVPGAATQFNFPPFVNGSTTQVVSPVGYEQIRLREGFFVSNNGVSGCTKMPPAMANL